MGSEMCIRDSFNGAAFSFTSLLLAGINFSDVNNLYFISDGINQIHVGSFNSGFGVLLTVDFVSDSISAEIVEGLENISTFFTEQDVFGHVLWTVNGQPFYYSGNFVFFNTGSLINPMSASGTFHTCLLYTSPSPRDLSTSRMPSSA